MTTLVDSLLARLQTLHEYASSAGVGAGAETTGFWSPRTATVDWCEANYAYTPYVAEFFNTLSSAPIFLLGAWGAWHGWAHGYRARFLVPIALFGLVGLGSMAFHGTLLFTGQAMDELPMIWAAAALLFSVFETKPEIERKWLAPALVLYCAGFTAAYLSSPDLFVFFLLTYIALILSLFFGSLAYYSRITHVVAKRLLVAAAVLYLGGFFLFWLPDKLACKSVQAFQFHALFHLTSTMGPWFMITHIVYAHYSIAETSARARRVRTEPEPTLVFVGGVLPAVDLAWPAARAARAKRS